MNVTELARKLKIPTKELREKLPQLGFDIGMRAIQIDDKVAQRVIEKWSEYSSKKEIKQETVEEISEEKKEEQEKIIALPPYITVHDLAEKLNLPVTKIIKELMKNGIIATINEKIDYETTTIISEDLGFKTKKIEKEEEKEIEIKERKEKLKELLSKKTKGIKNKHLITRPPVVVVMGHVDHGKTLLLDTIRKTNIIGQESGGITQHIGAYQVIMPLEKTLSSRASQKAGEESFIGGKIPRFTRDDFAASGRKITFIDTPGHEAFKSMRMRGGIAADIAILIVAADDHIQPQTLESIKIIQEEKLPFIVAINKIDKPESDIERIKKELSEINLIPEDWGGDVICIPISAETGKNIKDLLEMILLVADLEKDKLLADPEREAVGTIIESKINREAGAVATVLIHTGTLKIGDPIIVGNTYGKIKAIKNCLGQLIEEATPSMPVRFLGFKTAPKVGDILEVERDVKKFKRKIRKYKLEKEESIFLKTIIPEEKIRTLNVILKADALGSLEAISQSLKNIKTPEVKIEIVKQGLGNITETDISQAEGNNSLIIGFHITTAPSAILLAKDKNIEIKEFKIIYELIDYLKEKLLELLPPKIMRTNLGELKVLVVFRTEKDKMIIGGKVISGKIKNKIKADIIRENKIIGQGIIDQLQINKINIDEAEKNKECGIKFIGKPIIQVGDILIGYLEKEIERKLD